MTERLSLGFWLRTTLVIGGLNLQAKSYLHIIICLKPGWNYKGWRKKSRGCTRNWRSWASEGEGVRKRKILCEVSTCLEIKAHSREDPPLISDCSFHWKHWQQRCDFMSFTFQMLLWMWSQDFWLWNERLWDFQEKKAKLTEGMIFAEKMKKKNVMENC